MANYNLELANINLLQSGSLYCQAAGSNGTDNTVLGVHLRWAFARELGENHFPKALYSGGLSSVPQYQCTYGFNIDRDFVILFRIKYDQTFPTAIALNIAPNATSVLPDGRHKWEYKVNLGAPHYIQNTIYVIFDDTASYTNSYNLNINIPLPNYQKFYADYTGVINVGVKDKLSFAIGIRRKNTNGTMQLETVSIPDTQDQNNKIISSRKIFAPPSTISTILVESENIEYFRLKYSNGDYPVRISLQTYSDFIKYSEDGIIPKWTMLEGPTVGTAALTDFALSMDNPIVYDRLNTSNVNNIDDKWPKYNDSVPLGKFTTNLGNYVNRWDVPPFPASNETLKYALDRYLELSGSGGDPKAVELLPAIAPDTGSFAFSYFDFLKLASLDYHCARMLGFGFIDEAPPAIGSATDKYIYFALYQSKEYPGFLTAQTHGYMTLPTSMQTFRLPPPPFLTHLSYGLSMDNGSGIPVLITNANGYVPNEPLRYVNINKDAYQYDELLGPFFQRSFEFNLGDITRPCMYGIEYKESSAPGWVYPELSNDDEMFDVSGLNETVPIPEQANPIFTHEEDEEGIHSYAMYSINWFSRVSPISNILDTDYTTFDIAHTLLPPLNLTAQLIQPEDVLLLTSEDEQTMLSQISGDKTLVRVTFDYNHNHNINYQLGEKVQFFFREDLPANVRGNVSNVIDGLSDNRVAAETSDLTFSSTNSPPITPNLSQADFNKFVGGIFATNNNQFIIDDIVETNANGNYPTFILKKIKQNSVVEIPGTIDPLTGTPLYQTIENFVIPFAGESFMAIENASNQDNWQNKLATEVTLHNFLPTYTESYIEIDQTTTEINIGGIINNVASITNILDSVSNPTNFFHIVFSAGNPLPTLFPPDVDWYKGVVRALNNDNGPDGPQLREYEVVEIKRDASNLFLDPIELIILDAEFDPSNASSIHIDDSAGTQINFHPSYRTYLYVDTPNNFDEPHILPHPGQGVRKTYLAARTIDTTPPTGQVSSYLTMPVEINAREIVEPIEPLPPEGPLFATRPDFYGKSTYTFNNEVVLVHPINGTPREPFAYLFYRTSDNSVLKALYTDATITTILDDLKNLDPLDEAFNYDRWEDLVNGNYGDPANGNSPTTFNIYFPVGFQFPIPDNNDYSARVKNTSGNYIIVNPFTGTGDLETSISGTIYKVIDFVKRAIRESFTSLTEHPAIYKHIKDYSVRPPSANKPKIRDENGSLVSPSPTDPKYDPTPMIAKYEDDPTGIMKPYLRFTDYGLDGASKSQYFYYAAEMSNTLRIVNGPVLGPIGMVNAYPAESPQIKKVTTQLANEVLGVPSAVKFEINTYLKNENIKQFQIYRANDALSSQNLRTMQSAGLIPVGDEPFHELTDDFSDLNQVPYGDPLFYRVVAYREILNENNNTELIASLPSNIALCNVVDVVNPVAPEITTNAPYQTSSTPLTYLNVILSWLPTCYNGTYYLYKMNSSGNWNLLFSIKSNDSLDLIFTAGDLIKENDDGETIYHRFKVKVENSSGLYNLAEKELTI